MATESLKHEDYSIESRSSIPDRDAISGRGTTYGIGHGRDRRRRSAAMENVAAEVAGRRLRLRFAS